MPLETTDLYIRKVSIKENTRGGILMKKGQAAMEFLMTYGWSILVVLAAIAALAYFGILSPNRFLPETCTMPSGIACLDSAVDTTKMQIVLQNSAGFDMEDIVITSTEGGCGASETVDLTNGAQTTLNLTGCTFTSGSRLRTDLDLNYTNAGSGLTHSVTGQLTKQVS